MGFLVIMMMSFGYKRFVNLAYIFQRFSFWNLKEVVQIQWWGAWVVVSHCIGAMMEMGEETISREREEEEDEDGNGGGNLTNKGEDTFEQNMDVSFVLFSCYVDLTLYLVWGDVIISLQNM